MNPQSLPGICSPVPPSLASILRAALLLVSTACQVAPITEEPISKAEALDLLAAQAGEWNRGNIPGFVGFYSRDLSFLGADGLIHGDEDLVQRYQERYPDAVARGTLTLSLLDFRPLGTAAALVLGRYHLERPQPAEGYFTLVLERTPRGLEILHDHTTAAADDPGP